MEHIQFNPNSQIAQDTHETEHRMNWNAAQVKATRMNTKNRRILETCATSLIQNRCIEIVECYKILAKDLC